MSATRSTTLLLSLAISSALHGQATPRSEFEVASVRPASPANRAIALSTFPGGKIIVTQYTLELLVEEAFNVQHFQVAGGPKWMEDERFDITAIPAAASAASHANPPSPKFPMNEEQRAMLQSLLVDRFGLKFHIEDRDGPVYLLTRAARPLAMAPAADPASLPYLLGMFRQGGVVNGEMEGENVSLPFLAVKLGRYLERPVLDQTGLTGSYDIKLPAVDAGNTDVVAGIVDCVSRLGLKLKGGRGPVHTIVIDAATRPTEN